MKASNKTILYTKITRGNKVETHPIAVFPSEDACRPYAVAIMTAHKSGEAEKLRELGMAHLLSEDGKILPGLKFSRVTVPYAPDHVAPSEDPFADSKSEAA